MTEERDYGWRFEQPPTTKNAIGKDSIVWYEVLYDDDSVGLSCWWHDGWYGNQNWTGIVAYREVIKIPE